MIMKLYSRTSLCLSHVRNHVLRAMETSNDTALSSIDLQKTFNCLDHETLLEKNHLLAAID